MVSILKKINNIWQSPTKYRTNDIRFSQILIDSARIDISRAMERLNTRMSGLEEEEVQDKIKQYGLNEIKKIEKQSNLNRLFESVKNPLVILLIVLGIISYLTEDIRATFMIGIMVILSLIIRFFQELRADNAAEKLQAMVSTTATVIRSGKSNEVPLKFLVPGDIILLSAGDMVPADIRLLSTKDLFVNQSSLTGEPIPVEKYSDTITKNIKNPLDISCICFLGSNIETGTATALVVNTGMETYFGSLAKSVTKPQEKTSFDKGLNSFILLMISFMFIMTPLVFLFNGLSRGNWTEAFLFAVAVAVGLTPEMLPMIVTVNLAKGAITLSRKKVIVKQLNSIQNFGAMDILCTDKTGTITIGKIILEKHLDINGNENEGILELAYLNSYYQTGLKNLMDIAVLDHVDLEKKLISKEKYHKVDEIPFDFFRRRMSVVVEDLENRHTLICKGAFEEIIKICTSVEIEGKIQPLKHQFDNQINHLVYQLNADGFRVIALGYKEVSNRSDDPIYSIKDETDLILFGFLAFLDPPKDTANEAIQKLHENNVNVKILTGDNEVVTNFICKKVGLPVNQVLLGSAIEQMTEDELEKAVNTTNIYAKLSPLHKERIIRALQNNRHVVGFLGDGINDAPALKAADVGISVDTAVDIAKESSNIILLENSLLVLEEGIIEGRKVFGNIIKYIKMAASSNFGNMFSVLGGSIFLPFLPMLPLQVLTNNLLYDFSQTTIPTDDVDPEWLSKPRKWNIGHIRRFIIYIGPISSIFDYLTYFLMLFVFKAWNNPSLFHTGWFIESLFTQTLIIHVIRTNKIPFIQSRASYPLILTSITVVAIGAWITVSPIANTLGFTQLPSIYWLFLIIMLLGYITLTQYVKTWFNKTFGE